MDGLGEGLQLEEPRFYDKDGKVLIMSAANIKKKSDFYTVLKAKQKSHGLMGLFSASSTLPHLTRVWLQSCTLS